MNLMNEYLAKKLKTPELENELLNLIAQYNKLRNTYLCVYAAAISKTEIPGVELSQDDYFVFYDLLSGKDGISKIDIYLETPGGLGETVEDIVNFLRGKFEFVSFVVSGEAKSAGTIFALSGDEILMTETGSLGPIDAQVPISRSKVSAHEYLEWIKETRRKAQKTGEMEPIEATIVAQILPGELREVRHALEFAQELVVRWLQEYKFKDWTLTETRKKQVTSKMKEDRARSIAEALSNYSKWRSHARSLKIKDLNDIGLNITRIDDDPQLADIVYRIQTVCRLLLGSTSTIKLYATEESKIMKGAVFVGPPVGVPSVPPGANDVITFNKECARCGAVHKVYAPLEIHPQIFVDLKREGFKPFPKTAKISCKCGNKISILKDKNNIEQQFGRKVRH